MSVRKENVLLNDVDSIIILREEVRSLHRHRHHHRRCRYSTCHHWHRYNKQTTISTWNRNTSTSTNVKSHYVYREFRESPLFGLTLLEAVDELLGELSPIVDCCDKLELNFTGLIDTNTNEREIWKEIKTNWEIKTTKTWCSCSFALKKKWWLFFFFFEI